MEKYKVKNFVCHTMPSNELVIQNQKGIVKITNNSLISLIHYIEKHSFSKISYNEIEGFLGDNTDGAIEFLKSYGVIESLKKLNFNVDRVQFITNNMDFEEHLMFALGKLQKEISINLLLNNDLNLDFHNNDLILVLLNPYDKKLAQEITDKVKKNGKCVLMMTYMYNSNFFMDNLYSPKWKNPCHHCHMGSIESQLRVTENGNLSYQGLIDILYHEDNKFVVESPLSTIDLYSIGSLIFKRLDNLVFRTKGSTLFYGESLEDINNTIMFSLENKDVSNDTSIHWEMCDCYE
jgi:McbB family protein